MCRAGSNTMKEDQAHALVYRHPEVFFRGRVSGGKKVLVVVRPANLSKESDREVI